jgi:hypothetical protein
VSLWPDGTLNVAATLSRPGVPAQTLTGIMGKSSVAPPAPSVSSNAWTGPYDDTAYNVTVTGQVGSIATVVIDDGSTPVTGQVEGMDQIGSTGSLVVPLDVSYLADGPLTITTMLTNANGNSQTTTTTATKDTDPPPLQVSAPPYINNSNYTSFPITVYGEYQDTVSYTITDGTTTITSTRSSIPASGKWNANPNLSSLKNGAVTLTVTEVDPAQNQAMQTVSLYKQVATVAAPSVALNPSSDSGVSSSDYVTNVSAPLFVTSSASGTTVAVFVNGVAYTGQTLADGKYTVTAVATDAYGNASATATAPKTLVIVTSAPAGGWTVSGGKTINGTLTTNSKTPTLTLSFSDLGGISTVSTSTDGGVSWSSPVAYASSAGVALSAGDGVYTVSVRLTDVAGNVGTYTQSVRLDTTGPTISSSLSNPQSTIGYNGTADIALSLSISDVSGVASTTVKLDNTTTVTAGVIDVDKLLAGTHTLVITAVDGAGNSSTMTLTFALHPSRSGIANAVSEGAAAGSITSNEKTKLLSILNNANNTLKTDLTNFLSEVKNQSGKAISSSEATILQSWANDDLTNLY